MKYFKTRASKLAERYIITADSFQAATKCEFPFEQKTEQGKLSQYGICPSCLNSVQLIGLSHAVKVSPYGKHTGKTIAGLPDWKQQKYKYCPYARHSDYQAPDDQTLLPDIDQDIIALYDLLRNQFDRAVYIIQKVFHIRGTAAFWRKALRTYVINWVYCYPWLTESNLPYVFAMRGMQQEKCWGQLFEIHSEIYDAISTHPYAAWVDSGIKGYHLLRNKQGGFLKLVFRFYNHRQKAVNGEKLKESFIFCIDDNNTGNTIFQKKIEFDETYFINLIRADRSYRNQMLLQIANEEMPPLQATDRKSNHEL